MQLQPGDVAKIVISSFLFLFLVFVVAQIYIYHGRAGAARATYDAAKVRFDETQKDHDALQADLEYYLNPINLAKELKARFNYREEGEKTLILVPQSSQ